MTNQFRIHYRIVILMLNMSVGEELWCLFFFATGGHRFSQMIMRARNCDSTSLLLSYGVMSWVMR